MVKNPPASQETRVLPWRRAWQLHYSCLENSMGRGAWQAIVNGIAKSQTRLNRLSTQNTQTKPMKNLLILCSIKICVHTFRNDLHIILKVVCFKWLYDTHIPTDIGTYVCVVCNTPNKGWYCYQKTRSQVPSWYRLVLYFVIRYLRNGQSDFNYVWEMRDKEGEIGWQGKGVHL